MKMQYNSTQTTQEYGKGTGKNFRIVIDSGVIHTECTENAKISRNKRRNMPEDMEKEECGEDR